jgi:hypothetical protein
MMRAAAQVWVAGEEGPVIARYFSPAEVNRMVPELERIIKYLYQLESEIREKLWRLQKAKEEASGAGEIGFLQEEAEIDFIRIVVQGQFDRVREMGGDVKQGFLVDFLARIEGREVLLCWKPGETEVRWYHGVDEGIVGRKPIPEAFLEEGEASGQSEDE